MRPIAAAIFLLVLKSIIVIAAISQDHSNVVIVHGLGASRLEARVNATSARTPRWFCKKTSDDFFPVWLNIEELLPGEIHCFNFYLSPTIDEEGSKIYSDITGIHDVALLRNATGVEIRPIEGLNGVRYLDAGLRLGEVFDALVLSLQAVGYTPDVDLQSAPYDWRLGPTDLKRMGYFDALKSRIERLFDLHARRTSLVAHSLGTLVSLEFLSMQCQQWKDKYIARHIAMSPPYGGSVKTIQSMTYGDNFGIPIAPFTYFRDVQLTSASGPWVLPQPASWRGRDVAIVTPSKNYSVHDLESFLQDLGLDQLQRLYRFNCNHTRDLHAPLVDTVILHGSKVPTPEQFVFGEDFRVGTVPKQPLHVVMGDGDGTVNLDSMQRGLREWLDDHTSLGYALEYREFPLVDHMTILQTPPVLMEVTSIVTGKITRQDVLAAVIV